MAHHVLQRAVGVWREFLYKRAQVVHDVFRDPCRVYRGLLARALNGLSHVDEVAVHVKGQQWLWELETKKRSEE